MLANHTMLRVLYHLVINVFLLHLSIVKADPVVQQFDRIQINWGSLKINFHGQSFANKEDGDQALRKASQSAWSDGINYLLQNLPKICANNFFVSTEEKDIDLSSIAAQKTYSKNNIYYPNGLVRIELETPLWIVLLKYISLKDLPSLKNARIATQNSGVILKLSSSIKPIIYYTIVNESSEILFSIKDMYKESLQANMMGAWYIKPSLAEIKHIVGENPIELPVRIEDNNKFLISNTLWISEILSKNNFNLFKQGKIVIALP